MLPTSGLSKFRKNVWPPSSGYPDDELVLFLPPSQCLFLSNIYPPGYLSCLLFLSVFCFSSRLFFIYFFIYLLISSYSATYHSLSLLSKAIPVTGRGGP
jgi:hypothetical protein